MARAYFNFLNQKSTDFNLVILSDQTLGSASYDDSDIEIPGRDGYLTITKNRLKAVDWTFKCKILNSEPIEQVRTEISNWLLGQAGWHPLTWSQEPGYIYTAKLDGNLSVDVISKSNSNLDINFIVQPFKFLTTGQNKVAITNGQTLTNAGTLPSKPLIKITGSGDIKLTIGSTEFDLRKVDQGIILDCESQTATSLDGKRTQFDKLYSSFGTISVGSPKISWTGTATVEITPRWAVRV
ncbi:distal tail protein Dit [Latilactobacillus sakei]